MGALRAVILLSKGKVCTPYNLLINSRGVKYTSLSTSCIFSEAKSPLRTQSLSKLPNAYKLPHLSNSVSIRFLSCTALTNMQSQNKIHEGQEVNQTPQEGDSKPTPTPNQELSKKEKLKIAIRDYGGTVLVFHVTMSLASLGICYLLVSSGLDVAALLAKLGISESILESKATAEAGKFVVAYAVHKVFAPVRITITLTVTPLIVRKLRSMGILKHAVKQGKQG